MTTAIETETMIGPEEMEAEHRQEKRCLASADRLGDFRLQIMGDVKARARCSGR